MIVHAGLVATLASGKWRGVLIEGPSGSGKSDLALRVLERGFRLVADDRVILFSCQGRLFGRAPAPLVGLLEIRKLGISRSNSLRYAEIGMIVSCVGTGDIERFPRPKTANFLGIEIPAASLSALEASAPAKLCHAVEALGSAAQQDYDAAFQRNTPSTSF